MIYDVRDLSALTADLREALDGQVSYRELFDAAREVCVQVEQLLSEMEGRREYLRMLDASEGR